MLEKKTEEQLRHETRKEFGFSEERDTEKIDKVLEIKKDRYTATQQKKKAREELDSLKTSNDSKSENKEPKGNNESGKEPTLSVKDSARLQEANVPVDDWDDVIEYAKFKGIDVKDALGNSVVQATLAGKAEERKTAAASNTGGGKRGSSKVSGSTALNNARKGNFKEDDIDALVEDRYKPAA